MNDLRLLRAAPLALLFLGHASAQTTGNIVGVVTDAQTGKPIAGALVVATSPASQGEQTAFTDSGGHYRFQLLSLGEYQVAGSFEGFRPAQRADLTVNADKTIRANLVLVPDTVLMEEQVVRSSLVPAVNVGTAEAGTVISRDFLSTIPGGLTADWAAIAAPTAQLDRYGVSFAGASSPENGYLVDGVSATDTYNGLPSLGVLKNFVQEVDVKTGSFMPEYGFSSGGIVSLVTRSGSNEFHGSVFASLSPGTLRGDAKVSGRNAEALAVKPLPREGTYDALFGFEVGGPILKDRLWFYAGFAPQVARSTSARYQQAVNFTEVETSPGNWEAQTIKGADGYTTATPLPGSERKQTDRDDSYQLIGKLTWLFDENNQLAVSIVSQANMSTSIVDINAAPSAATLATNGSSSDVVARFTSRLLGKKLQLELTGGYHEGANRVSPSTVNGIDSGAVAFVRWNPAHSLSDFEAVSDPGGLCTPGIQTGFDPCTVTGYSTGGLGWFGSEAQRRLVARAALTWFTEAGGTHQVKGGVEVQQSSFQDSYVLSGGAGMIEFNAEETYAPGQMNLAYVSTLPNYPIFFREYRPGTVSADRLSAVTAPGGRVDTKAEGTIAAYYLQDSWQPSLVDGLTVNAGVRWETQRMSAPDSPGSPTLSVADSIGPRVQLVYDWTRQGRSKVAASWGRFYQTFPVGLAYLAFNEQYGYRNVLDHCFSPAAVVDKTQLAGKPETCPLVENFFRSSALGVYTYAPAASGVEPVDPGIRPPYLDMFGVGVEYELLTDLSVAIDYTGRRQGTVIEDMSDDEGQTFAISNPGTGKPFQIDGTTFDPKNSVGADPVTGRMVHMPIPRAVRSYDGLTFSLKKSFSGRWLAQGSYTWSSLRGNYTGFFRPENGQLTPGWTPSFDTASMMVNQSGPLPGDRPHVFKLFGSYAFDLGRRWQASAGTALRVESGAPVSYLMPSAGYGGDAIYALPRGSAGRTPMLTTFDLKGGVAFTFLPPYRIQLTVDLFNVLNAQAATSLYQQWTTDASQQIVNGQCARRNAVSGSDPIAAALADCPDLRFMKSASGRSATINQLFGRAQAWQDPRSVRLGLEMSF
jgi:hypothetical protein